MGKLTLVTGMPGTRVRAALDGFSAFARDAHGHDVRIHSVEAEFQRVARPRVAEFQDLAGEPTVVQTFLLPRPLIRSLWQEAFDRVWLQVLEDLETVDVILTLHLTFFLQLTREYFIPADIPSLVSRLSERAAEVVTLVDDIYDCHQSLIAGGTGSGMLDSPSSPDDAILALLQVLDWRSIESTVTESVAASASKHHYIIAVKHPKQTLFDLLYSEKRVAYLSHPISEPRRQWIAGDREGAAALVRRMSQMIARLQANATIIEPTGIDELRFFPESDRLSDRWPFGRDERDLLYVRPVEPPLSGREFLFPIAWDDEVRPEIPASTLHPALEAAIRQQINARDHSLVEQSDLIACYRPLFAGNASGGVQEEIYHFGRLVKLDLRQADGQSVVFSPDEDDAKYPARVFLEQLLPNWRRNGLVTGAEEDFTRLAEHIGRGEEAALRLLSEGAEAVRTVLGEHRITITPEPGGALAAAEPARRQAAGSSLANQIAAARVSYLSRVVDDGGVRLVKDEQVFYDSVR